MIVEQSRQIIAEVNKAFIGKNEIVFSFPQIHLFLNGKAAPFVNPY